ncbi:recombinase family protein [Streptomyces sp. RKAG290]|nr:recombinase family protein [Streptomyces sp. RKAG290]
MARGATDETGLRAAVYLRVSTKSQLKGFGLSSQHRKAVEYLTDKGWRCVASYSDGGVSGALDLVSRPEGKRLMEAARRGEFDVVVVREARAIGRTGRAFWRWVWALEDLGVFVSIADSGIDNTTAGGRYQLVRRAEFSLREWEAIQMRSQDGLQEKALVGGWVGGQPPYGYRIADKGRRGVSRLAVDPRESAVLRRAWELIVDEGMNVRQAALVLNAEGRFTRSGSPWRQQNLRARLGSDAILGARSVFRHPSRSTAGESHTRLKPDGTPLHGETVTIALPRIFAEDELMQLRAGLKRGAASRVEAVRAYPLSGRIFNSCGAHYVGQWRVADKTRMYRCSGKDEEYAGAPTCSCPLIDADALEERVWCELAVWHRDQKGEVRVAQEGGDYQRVDQSHRVAALGKQIDGQMAVINAVVSSVGSQEAADQTVNALVEEVAQLRALQAEARAWQEEGEAEHRQAEELRKWAMAPIGRLRDLGLERQLKLLALWDVRVQIIGTRSRSIAGRPCSLNKWFTEHGVLVPRSLTDAAWAKIEPLMPGSARVQPYRQLVDAILYKARTGVRWCDLPERFGNHSTIHTRCSRWVASGLWSLIMGKLDSSDGQQLPEPEVLPPLRVEIGAALFSEQSGLRRPVEQETVDSKPVPTDRRR